MAALLVACLEELDRIDSIETMSVGPWVDAPLVNTTFNTAEFLTEGNSKAKLVDQSGILTLIYDDSIASPTAANYFGVPNQVSPTLTITGPEVTFPSSGATITLTRNITFAFNPAQGEVFDSLWLTTGQIVVTTSSTFNAGVQLAFSAPTFQSATGQTLAQNYAFGAAGNQTRTTSLAGHTIDLTLNGTATNTISFTVVATITDTGQAINATDQIRFGFALNTLRFKALFGQLGTRIIQIPSDSVSLDVFAGVTSRNFVLLAPLISLQTRNSFGLPIAFNILNFSGTKSDNTVVQLTGSALSPPSNPYMIGAPTYSQIGGAVTSTFTLNDTNSNLGTLIGALPYFLSYQFNSQLNPGAAAPKNFVLDTSRVRVKIHVELPFHGRAQQISFSKRFSFSGIGVDGVGETAFKIRAANEFPFDARIQAYFRGPGGAIIDSLFTDAAIIKAAPVDANGFTQTVNEFITILPLTQAKIDRIDLATQIDIAASINTTNNGTVPVKFSTTDRLTVAIGVHTRIYYKIN